MLDFDQSVAAKAIRSLVVAGTPEGEIHQLVTSIAAEERGRGVATAGDDLPVYDVLPDGLIDLPSAAAKYNRSIYTIHGWIRYGRLRVVGRLRAPAARGGYLVVSESDLMRLNTDTPRRRRRPA